MDEELTQAAEDYADILRFIDMLDANVTDDLETPRAALLMLFGYVHSKYLIPELPDNEIQAVYAQRRQAERNTR